MKNKCIAIIFMVICFTCIIAGNSTFVENKCGKFSTWCWTRETRSKNCQCPYAWGVFCSIFGTM